jgi:hypothetical protein
MGRCDQDAFTHAGALGNAKQANVSAGGVNS